MKSILPSKNGFALVAALVAICMLTVFGLLVFAMSTQDIRISSRVIGEKKAFCAVEAGIHRFVQIFDPLNPSASMVTNATVDPGNDPSSLYTIGTPSPPTAGPATISLPGYAVAGGQQWGQVRFNVEITGTNTRYSSLARVRVGAGYGPIEISTAYR